MSSIVGRSAATGESISPTSAFSSSGASSGSGRRSPRMMLIMSAGTLSASNARVSDTSSNSTHPSDQTSAQPPYACPRHTSGAR